MNPKIGRSIGRIALSFKKNLPTITAVASGVFATASTVSAAVAAYKSVPTIEEHKRKIEQLRANKDKFDDVKEYNKAVAVVYRDTGLGLAKVFWVPAASLGFTLAGIFASDSIHRKRYITMAGMHAAVSTAFSEYRKRTRDRFGEDVERELYLNMNTEEVVTVETDRKGNEKTKLEIVKKPTMEYDATYSLFLIEPKDKCWYYGRPDMTMLYLNKKQEMLTQKLRSQGFLFLNDVLDALEKPLIPEGQFIGWLYDPDRGKDDNCVDFGLNPDSPFYDPENVELFLSGKNEYLYISMNHDGTMYDKFPFYDRIWVRNDARRV